MKDKIIKGANFCHVIKIKLFIHEIPSITLGNQKWKGAIPLLIIKVVEKVQIIIVSIKLKKILFMINNKIIQNNKLLDAKAWIKKYFNEASVDNIFSLFIIKGINDNKLISNPIQILNQFIELILIIVPLNNENKNNSLKEFFKIKKKRNRNLYK